MDRPSIYESLSTRLQTKSLQPDKCISTRPVQAIQAEQIGGFDLMILTETKVTNQSYCCDRMIYDMVCL